MKILNLPTFKNKGNKFNNVIRTLFDEILTINLQNLLSAENYLALLIIEN